MWLSYFCLVIFILPKPDRFGLRWRIFAAIGNKYMLNRLCLLLPLPPDGQRA